MHTLRNLSKLAQRRIPNSIRLIQHTATGFNNVNNQSSVLDESIDDAEFIDKFTKEFNERKIEISEFQRALLAIGASITALMDPHRHDSIASLGETTGVAALKKIYEKMSKSDEGRALLFDKPRINTKTVCFDTLKSMPHNTLGYNYWKFLQDNHVTPDTRLEVRFMDDPMLAYIMTRYRENHDLVHALLDMPTTMLGEVAIKWVEATNTGLPMCYGGAVFGAMRLKTKHRKLYSQYYLPWAIKTGSDAKPLMNIYWEKRWDQDIDELRKELNVEVLTIPKQ